MPRLQGPSQSLVHVGSVPGVERLLIWVMDGWRWLLPSAPANPQPLLALANHTRAAASICTSIVTRSLPACPCVPVLPSCPDPEKLLNGSLAMSDVQGSLLPVGQDTGFWVRHTVYSLH